MFDKLSLTSKRIALSFVIICYVHISCTNPNQTKPCLSVRCVEIRYGTQSQSRGGGEDTKELKQAVIISVTSILLLSSHASNLPKELQVDPGCPEV